MTDHMATMGLRRTPFALALNIAGMAVSAVYFVPQLYGATIRLPQLTVPFALVALAGWIAALIVPPGRLGLLRACYLVMIVGGATAAWDSNGLLIVPVIAGLLAVAGGDPLPWVGHVYGITAATLVAVGALAAAAVEHEPISVESVLSLECGVLIAVLGGANRRQARAREAARQEAAVQAESARAEQAKAEALALRQGLARDMHDVLAHSLGGLVIQLDATEAQLEAGKRDAALARLRDARSMAASGLAEARRAVEALRAAPDAASRVTGADLAASVIDLVDAHERLGGTVDFEQLGEPGRVTAEAATALRRAVQESLSNARKHAPGAPIAVRIAWKADRVRLTVSNPVPDAVPAGGLAATGAGHGLLGMRERFGALPDGEVVSGRRGDEFVVDASVALARTDGGENGEDAR